MLFAGVIKYTYKRRLELTNRFNVRASLDLSTRDA